MNLFRKFYDADIADAGGETQVVEEQHQEQLSPGEALAKFGQKSDENRVAPVNIPEKKEEVKQETETKAATAEGTETEEQKSETPQENQVEAKQGETPKITEPAKPTLEEVLKINNPDTVLKALGFDDQKAKFVSELKDVDPKILNIIDAYKQGTLGEYVKVLSTDYTQMSAEEVMRNQLRQEYPKATEKQLEILYRREIVDAYNLDSVDDDLAEEGKLLLEAKAEKYRDKFIEKQSEYFIPKANEPKADVVPENTEELQKQQLEAYKKDLLDNPYTKDIVASKKITFGEGDEKFSFSVEPTELVDILADGSKWVEALYDKQKVNGEDRLIPNIEKQMLVALVAKHGTKFLDEYAKHHKAIGGKSVVEPIDNASVPDRSKPAKSEAEPTSPAAMLARKGVRSTGG